MCILITEDEKKKKYRFRAKSAGMKDEQLEPMVNVLWDMKISKNEGEAKSKLVMNGIKFICR